MKTCQLSNCKKEYQDGEGSTVSDGDEVIMEICPSCSDAFAKAIEKSQQGISMEARPWKVTY